MNQLQVVNNGKLRNSHLFQKGQSGNPLGRPRSDATITALAKEHTELALQTLVEIMRNKRAPASARVNASAALLDRGYGKPHQHIESVNMGMTYQDWITNEARRPTEEELAEAGYTLADLQDDDYDLKDC